MNMTNPEHRSDAGLATALRISVSRLARRLRVNLAAFTTNYDRMQLTEYQELGAPLTVNAGDSRIRIQFLQTPDRALGLIIFSVSLLVIAVLLLIGE